MDSNDELEETDIKKRTWYYFRGIIETKDFVINNILIDEKAYKNILAYNIWYKRLSEPLPVRLTKIDGFIRVDDRTRCLVLFESEKFDYI